MGRAVDEVSRDLVLATGTDPPIFIIKWGNACLRGRNTGRARIAQCKSACVSAEVSTAFSRVVWDMGL